MYNFPLYLQTQWPEVWGPLNSLPVMDLLKLQRQHVFRGQLRGMLSSAQTHSCRPSQPNGAA